MAATELHNFLEKWRKLNSLPSTGGWPVSFYLPSNVWTKFKDLMKYTKGDGHEYAVNLFHVDGEIIVTPQTRGDYHTVTTRDSVSVQYKPKDKYYYEKHILVNAKLVQKSAVEIKKVPKQISIIYLFNVHTHPIQKESYSFFSDTDMRSFLSSSAMVMGLLTDQLWVVAKTSSSLKTLGENGVEVLNEISQKIFNGERDVDKLIRENMKSWGLIFYQATPGNSLKKLI